MRASLLGHVVSGFDSPDLLKLSHPFTECDAVRVGQSHYIFPCLLMAHSCLHRLIERLTAFEWQWLTV
jgi:hypothetical protein